MDWDRYDLFFGPMKVGVVIQSEVDFPNLFGNIIYDSSLSEPQSTAVARLVDFLDLSRRSAQLLDMWDGIEPSPELKAVDAELEASYQDFVDSEDWSLVDGQGHRSPILCPVLQDDDEIVWRWGTGAE